MVIFLDITMFQVFDSEVVGFPSKSKIQRNVRENETQTTALLCTHVSISTEPKKDFQFQTDIEIIPKCISPTILLEGLNNILPKILNELEDDTTGFHNSYESAEKEEEEEITITQIQNIKEIRTSTLNSPTFPSPENLQPVSCLSWSCNGRKLAVGYGNYFHNEWCQHDGFVNIFTKSHRDDLLKFSVDIKLSSCVTNVAFHNFEQSILAISTITGIIAVYNLELNKENKKKCLDNKHISHLIRSTSHLVWLTKEQISKYLSDFSSMTSENHILVSAGTNGEVIFWKINFDLFSFTPQQCFRLKVTSPNKLSFNPDISKIDFIRTWKDSKDLIEADSDRNMFDDYFAVGTRTGDIFICRTLMANSIDSTFSEPHVEKLCSHKGCILSLKFSQRSTAGLISLGDREIKILNILQDSPIRVIHLEHEISELGTLPEYPDLTLGIITSAEQSQMQCLNIAKNTTVNVKRNETIDQNQNGPNSIIRLVVNPSRAKTVACGTADGRVLHFHYFLKDL